MAYIKWLLFSEEWSDSPMIATNNAVTSENNWGNTSPVSKKSLLTVNHALIYLLHAIYALNTSIW